MTRSRLALPFAVLLGSCLPLSADVPHVTGTIVPFVRQHCAGCHNEKTTRGDLDLTRFTSAESIVEDFRTWQAVVEFTRTGKMPPPDEAKQPAIEERNAFAEAVEAVLLAEALRHAGDPGHIPPRRLSRTEYDNAVRDLVGVDIRPTTNFPPDPAGGEGFDNTGEALGMSPSLLRKYLEAAETVGSHLVLQTDGLRFAPHPVTSYNERKKLAEGAIIDFYARHDVRLRDYLASAWRFQHRTGDDAKLDLKTWAERDGLNAKYLRRVHNTLDDASAAPPGYLKSIGDAWDALPAPEGNKLPDALSELERQILFARTQYGHVEPGLIRSNAGNWPIGHLAFREEVSSNRNQPSDAKLVSSVLLTPDPVRAIDPRRKKPDEPPRDWVVRFKVERAFAGAREGVVIFRDPILSRSRSRPKNDKDQQKHEVEPLRTFLERHAPQLAKRLRFGRHPAGGSLPDGDFALRTGESVELRFDHKLRQRLDRKGVVVTAVRDLKQTPGAAIHVRCESREIAPQSRTAPEWKSDPLLLLDPKSDAAEDFRTSARQFCATFPNRYAYVDSRRGLAAGFHLVEGFYRDDRPLVELVLTDEENAEIDRLWSEFDFLIASAETLLRGFVWFEGAERHQLHGEQFDFVRPQDPELVEPATLARFEREYLKKQGVKLDEKTGEPVNPEDAKYRLIHGFFEDIRSGLKTQQAATVRAEAEAWDDLRRLLRRAWRRPVSDSDLDSLHRLYDELRGQGQSIEESFRGLLTAVLMSPDFLYRHRATAVGSGVERLSDLELANRLAFFLWSSLPDEELLTLAEAGRLRSADELWRQTARMLSDERAESFAREFFGQWLRYRAFPATDPIIDGAFNQYDTELRRAMAEEPVRLLTWLIRSNQPITALLDSDVTFVNERLAEHYGGAIRDAYRRAEALPNDDGWRKVTGLRDAGRGGLPGMAVVLTTNSAGQRTSPVKRGFWVAHHLLGQHFPPPPADVPELPASEKEAPQTIRTLLAAHAENARCAMCHVHFDGLGLALEGFDAIGRARTKDAAGRPIDDAFTAPHAPATTDATATADSSGRGIGALIQYLREERAGDFRRTFCRKFLGYALGRSVLLSDRPLLDRMESELIANGDRFSVLFDVVITSKQFLNKRSGSADANTAGD